MPPIWAVLAASGSATKHRQLDDSILLLDPCAFSISIKHTSRIPWVGSRN
jgi:hypothetical protein